MDYYPLHLNAGGVLNNIGNLVDYAFGKGGNVKAVHNADMKVDNYRLAVSPDPYAGIGKAPFVQLLNATISDPSVSYW